MHAQVKAPRTADHKWSCNTQGGGAKQCSLRINGRGLFIDKDIYARDLNLTIQLVYYCHLNWQNVIQHDLMFTILWYNGYNLMIYSHNFHIRYYYYTQISSFIHIINLLQEESAHLSAHWRLCLYGARHTNEL